MRRRHSITEAAACSASRSPASVQLFRQEDGQPAKARPLLPLAAPVAVERVVDAGDAEALRDRELDGRSVVGLGLPLEGPQAGRSCIGLRLLNQPAAEPAAA